MSEDSGAEVERRKMLVKGLPFMLNVFWEARTALSPGKLASIAIDQYQEIEKSMKLQQEELAVLAGDLGSMDLKVEGVGRISLTLSKEQLLNFIGSFLISHFARDGSRASTLRTSPRQTRCDATLSLPNKTIFVKLRKTLLDQHSLDEELEEAKSLNPSEVWIFPYYESQEKDIRLDPVFVSENRTLHGHLRVMPISGVIKKATRGRFYVFALKSAAQQPENDSLRLLLIKNVDSAS